MLMSTSNVIPGYRLEEIGFLVYGIGSRTFLNEAMDDALVNLESGVEDEGYNAIIGISHSVTFEGDSYTVSMIGTACKALKEL